MKTAKDLFPLRWIHPEGNIGIVYNLVKAAAPLKELSYCLPGNPSPQEYGAYFIFSIEKSNRLYSADPHQTSTDAIAINAVQELLIIEDSDDMEKLIGIAKRILKMFHDSLFEYAAQNITEFQTPNRP